MNNDTLIERATKYAPRMQNAARIIARFNTSNGKHGDMEAAMAATFEELRQMYVVDRKALDQVLAVAEGKSVKTYKKGNNEDTKNGPT